jgi:hypothetical protein
MINFATGAPAVRFRAAPRKLLLSWQLRVFAHFITFAALTRT